jgi:hypothetical protein
MPIFPSTLYHALGISFYLWWMRKLDYSYTNIELSLHIRQLSFQSQPLIAGGATSNM